MLKHQTMKILISNDDGVHAPGIAILAAALAEIAEVHVVAPDRNRSGSSNSLTLHRPVSAWTLPNGFISVQGTPTDCVHLAVTGLLQEQPDMVVSGINEGANLSDDILYSGTVAAATEGRFLGLPALAISLAGEKPTHYQTAAEVAKQLVLHLRNASLPASTILNVNVPDVALDLIQGYQVTRLGSRHRAEPTIKDTDPRGNPIYWVGPPGLQQDDGPGTDFFAIANGYVSVTPLHVDLTHYRAFEQVASWLSNINKVAE